MDSLLPLLFVLGGSAAPPSPLPGSPLGPHPDGGPDPARRLDVLVLVVDDLGWEDLRGLSLPNLEQRLPLGRVYTNCVASSTSSPSRYQLHFGRYPHRAGIGGELDPAADRGAPTADLSLAERLSVAGHRTACFGGWQVNGEALPMRTRAAARIHGYERWRAGSPAGLEPTGQSHFDWLRVDDGKTATTTVYSTSAIVDAVDGWWSVADGPRLAVAAFLAPHAPYDAPPAALLPAPVAADAAPRARYEAALAALDAELGRLFAAVDTTDTWVFLCGDNGTPADVPPPGAISAGYAPTLFQGGIHTPLVVWGPGVVPGTEEALVQLVDLPATVLELLDVDARVGFEDSISFAPTLFGAPGAREFAFVQRFAPNGLDAPAPTLDEWAVVRADGWKLLGDATGLRLFDLGTDPGETTPVDAPRIEAELLELRAAALGPDWPY
jgi:arylsulfatase A-like enzyme